MIYEITLLTPTGKEFTDRVDLPLDPELRWDEFCEHRAFLHWKKHRESWPVIDITPEDLIGVKTEPEEPEVEADVAPPVTAPPPLPVEKPKPEPKPEPRGRFIDKWSGRITKNVEFTQWMAKAKLNGINELTFKSRVYKLKYDYARAATQPTGQQGYKQRETQ